VHFTASFSERKNLFRENNSPGQSIQLSDPTGSYRILSDPMLDHIEIRHSDVIPIGFLVTELHRNPLVADPIGLSVGSDSQIRCVKKGIL